MQKRTYDGQEYSVCDSLEQFTAELQRVKRAILVTEFSRLRGQIQHTFKFVSERFGADSEESRAVTTPMLFCGSCGVAFSSTMLMLLITPYSNREIPKQCPRCASQKTNLMCQL